MLKFFKNLFAGKKSTTAPTEFCYGDPLPTMSGMDFAPIQVFPKLVNEVQPIDIKNMAVKSWAEVVDNAGQDDVPIGTFVLRVNNEFFFEVETAPKWASLARIKPYKVVPFQMY